MEFNQLVGALKDINTNTQNYAIQQVNHALTVRNCLFGFYLVEYEQKGSDRALYGQNLYQNLSIELADIKGMSIRNLYFFKSFYLCYPSILQTVSTESPGLLSKLWLEFSDRPKKDQISDSNILQTLSAKSESTEIQGVEMGVLLSKLSFSHFIELTSEMDPQKRKFYEIQTVQNNWSVRELRREMESLLYERIGLSTRKESLIKKSKEVERLKPADVIKSPYILDFLGLDQKPEYSESDLEQALIDHLQRFLMELGRGFCFESRQKRITFDNTHYYIDLVFYHRILKCHVLVDLKLGAFSHADAGQMNVYLNYFNEQEKTEGDNPPIGIILCSSKNESLVKYATTGMSQEVFVAKYQIVLPTEKELKDLIEADTKAFQEKEKNL